MHLNQSRKCMWGPFSPKAKMGAIDWESSGKKSEAPYRGGVHFPREACRNATSIHKFYAQIGDNR